MLEGLSEGNHIITFSTAYKWAESLTLQLYYSANAPTIITGTYTPLSTSYVVLAYNDLGMHCLNQDFSAFMVLPPYNNLYAQVIQRGGEDPQIVSSGLTVSYYIPANTTSAGKTNFWDYAGEFFFSALLPRLMWGSRAMAFPGPWLQAAETTGLQPAYRSPP